MVQTLFSNILGSLPNENANSPAMAFIEQGRLDVAPSSACDWAHFQSLQRMEIRMILALCKDSKLKEGWMELGLGRETIKLTPRTCMLGDCY